MRTPSSSARDAGQLPVNIAAVISNRPDAKGLETASRAGITAHFIDHKAFAGRVAFDAALAECIDQFNPDLVVLAGFMRILSEGFVRHYAGRLMNIHPSLLPSFPGLHTHQRALEEGGNQNDDIFHLRILIGKKREVATA